MQGKEGMRTMAEEENKEQTSTTELVKLEWLPHSREMTNLGKAMRGKLICHLHNQKIYLKCEHPDCRQPFLCLHYECIDSHFHAPLLQLGKINKCLFEEKFKQAEAAFNSSASLFERAYQIKAVVDSLKSSVGMIFKDMTNMQKLHEDLKGEATTALNTEFIRKIEDAVSLEAKILGTIEKIKTRMQNPQTAQSFPMKGEIGTFLEGNINNFQIKTAKVLFNSKESDSHEERLHETLQGKSNLVFLFIGERIVIGSYFSCPYPSITKRRAKDPSSFLFVATPEPSFKVLKYLANSDSPHHIEVSQRFLASQGRLNDGEGISIHRNSPDLLQLGLPCESFPAEKVSEDGLSETLRIGQIIVMQVSSDP